MPHGYHIYAGTLELAQNRRWASEGGLVQLGAKQQMPGLVGGWHEAEYDLPRDQEIRAGGQFYPHYEIPYRGAVWVADQVVLLEMRGEVVHDLAAELQRSGAPMKRLVVPNLKAIYPRLPNPKTSIRTHHPQSADRFAVTVRGANIDGDRRNRDELNTGELAEVEFSFGGRQVVVYDDATVLLRSNYDNPTEAALAAWQVWRTYFKPHAVEYRRGWRRRG